ncbi:MAG: copper oxidase, partial [Sphingobacteriales bacterium]
AHAHHGSHNTPTDLVTLNYAMLRAPEKTTLPNAPTRTLRFNLTGNMNRFVWTIDHKVVSEVDKILIKQGENIRIIMTNNSMMRHPMHLHGHDFRVLNGQGDFAPMKNVIDIMPMETDTIEFHANAEYGDWFFHCHILYHMMSGMGRIFRYENTPPNPQLPHLEKANKVVFADDRKFYPGAEISLESNGSDGEVWAGNTRWLVQADWHVGLTRENGYEIESNIGRYLDNNQFLRAYFGGDLRSRNTKDEEAGERNLFRQTDTHNSRFVGVLGINYILPWFIQTDLRVDHTGNLRLQISRDDIPITTRLRLWGRWNSDYEYSAGARYILTKYWALSSHYDSDMGPGVGVTFVY